jgi:putative ABC transport system ATP-binding protein
MLNRHEIFFEDGAVCMGIIELHDVSYTYRTQFQQVEALKHINYIFEEGRIQAIIGRSGSGKTTLLSLMAGLDLPTSGEVICEGKSTASLKLENYRREKVAVIYQSFRLLPLLTAVENVMYPMELKGMKSKAARLQAEEYLKQVGLPETVFERYPALLSGGEQQRVAIARALGMNTKILLADEPTGNLDEKNGENIFQILQSLAHDKGYCVVIVTHDKALAARTDSVLTLKDGVIV